MGTHRMNTTHIKYLETFEATLKARLMAADAVLASVLGDDHIDILKVYQRHERALNRRVSVLAKEIGALEGIGPETESELREAALELVKRY